MTVGNPALHARRPRRLDTVSIAVATVVAQAATALVMVIVARRAGPDAFGVFAAVYAFGLGAGALLDFGSSARMARELARGNGAEEFRSWYVRKLVLVSPAALAVAVSCFVYGNGAIGAAASAALGGQAGTYVAALGAMAAARGLSRPVFAVWALAVGNLVVLAVAVLCPAGSTVLGVALASCLSWVATAAVCLAVVWPRIAGGVQRSRGNPWAGSAPFGVTAFVGLAQAGHIALVSAAAGHSAAGSAAAVTRWVLPITLLSTSFATDAFPRFAAADSTAAALRHLRSGLPWFVAGVGFAGATWALAPDLTDRLLGGQYQGAAAALRVGAVGAVAAAGAQPLSSFLQGRGHERVVAWVAVVSTLVTLPAVYVGARLAGAPGLAWGQLPVLWAVFALYGWQVRQISRRS